MKPKSRATMSTLAALTALGCSSVPSDQESTASSRSAINSPDPAPFCQDVCTEGETIRCPSGTALEGEIAAFCEPVPCTDPITGAYGFSTTWDWIFDTCGDPEDEDLQGGEGEELSSISPVRVLDTVLAVGATRRVQIDPNAKGAVVTVTVDSPARNGFVTVWSGGQRPVTSTLNPTVGRATANTAFVKLDKGGGFYLYNDAGGRTIVDVNAHLKSSGGIGGGRFVAVPNPVRLLDTRMGGGRVGAATVQIPTDRWGIPSSQAVAVAVNVTAVDAQESGFATIFPGNTQRPTASFLNFVAGDTIASGTVVKLGTNKAISIFSSTPAHYIVDLQGIYINASSSIASSKFTPLPNPVRVLDTRTSKYGVPTIQGDRSIKIPFGDIVSGGARAAVVNLTVTNPSGAGYMTMYGVGNARPQASNINFGPGQTRANLAIVPITKQGLALYSSTTAGAIVDVVGFMHDGPRVGSPF